ncbi:MAG: DUF4920 domain-containing protein [Crocinitomix sp.]|nr:DUF4920 domain-containing protein [Crocinitomix sp.]
MNKKLIIGLAIASFAGLYSCGGTEVIDEPTDADSTAVVEAIDTTEAEPEIPLAFDGVDKGDYTLYGHSEIDADGSETTVEAMNAAMAENGAFEGKVAVTINEVCQMAGCWITFENGDEDPIRVFFRDHFTIPTETAAGTEAILYGATEIDTQTVEFQKHLLDDAAATGDEVPQEEYDAITEDLITTSFDCESILVKK